MNKLLIGSVALAAMIAGPAMAADMPLKAPPPVPVFSWTGCYWGGQIGYGWARARATATAGVFNGADKTAQYNVSGELGGGEIGCNYQVGNWVWGVEVTEDQSFSAATLASQVAIERHSKVGWVVGFGTEYALAYGWSAKWETLYMDFGHVHSFDAVACCTAQDTRFTQWVSRFGLNYRFNWGKYPVVAKY